MWLRRLQKYKKLARKVSDKYPSIAWGHDKLPPGISKHIDKEESTLRADILRCMGDRTTPGAAAMALSLLETFETNHTYRTGFVDVGLSFVPPAIVDQRCVEGDLASALYLQEARVVRLFKVLEPEGDAKDRLMEEVKCYVHIYQGAAERCAKIHKSSTYPTEFAIPPLHNLLFIVEHLPRFPFVLADFNVAGETDFLGRTLLHLALDLEFRWPLHGESDLELLRKMANHQDGLGRIPVAIASAANAPGILDMLVPLTTRVDENDRSGRTALHYAAESKNKEAVTLLVQAGADVNAVEDPERVGLAKLTPLSYAVANIDLDMITELMKAGAHSDCDDVNENAPVLMGAVQRNHDLLVELLLQHGADPNIYNHQGETPLTHAAKKGYFYVVEVLLENKRTHLSLKERTDRGWTALVFAAEGGHKDVVELLLGHRTACSTLINAKYQPNGATALIYAAQKGYEIVVKQLLAAGADQTIVCDKGSSPLHYAVSLGHADVVETLVFHGAFGLPGNLQEWGHGLIKLAKDKGYAYIADTIEGWMDT